jgi:hypothetical protein
MARLVFRAGSEMEEVEGKKGWEVKRGLELMGTYLDTALILLQTDRMVTVVQAEEGVYLVKFVRASQKAFLHIKNPLKNVFKLTENSTKIW